MKPYTQQANYFIRLIQFLFGNPKSQRKLYAKTRIIDAYKYLDPTDSFKAIIYVNGIGSLMFQSKLEMAEIHGVIEYEKYEKSILQIPIETIAIDFLCKKTTTTE